MGHNHLGRLPKTRQWAEVMELLDILHPDTAAVASAVAKAADFRLRKLANDPRFGLQFLDTRTDHPGSPRPRFR